MEKLALNKDSWHYNLATVVNRLFRADAPDLLDSPNICQYFWWVVFMGCVVLIATPLIASLIYMLLIAPIMHIIMCFILGFVPPDDWAQTGYTFMAAIFILGIIGYCIYHLQQDPTGKIEIVKQKLYNIIDRDNFITEAYYSFRDKYCVQIEFKSKKEK